ncbi:sulfurtransferase TusA family protein [Bordetella sp. BOR01]|uniref:sulfurtransferase TusA family protein n=1 Tax=Bordetella sp. BOR01 TaxID=2854779 RepID=UPI001C456F35|nr:sulfurtransferase TusA family protein [Bordetella sp. BOR01]MBV7482373.1 sulfurtransferase TusA family protein [Bordetella sp. BOR01]
MNASDPVADLPAFQHDVDASGLTCPLPILRAKKALAQMESGQVLRVATTDPKAVRDFQAFARQSGNALVAQHESQGGALHFLRRR